MHIFKCAACGKEFSTEKRADRCPHCKSRVLIHVSGESLKSKNCSGCCSGCSGCGK